VAPVTPATTTLVLVHARDEQQRNIRHRYAYLCGRIFSPRQLNLKYVGG
jgi:hypothetical protein